MGQPAAIVHVVEAIRIGRRIHSDFVFQLIKTQR